MKIRATLRALSSATAIALCIAAAACTGDEATTSNAITCTQGTTMPCTCASGAPGNASCQLDGTFSVCQCNPGAQAGSSGVAAGSGGAAGSVALPTAGVGAGTGAGSSSIAGSGAGSSAGGGAGTGAPQPVIVAAEDVAKCSPMGVAPAPTEQTETLQIRTGDVVPGGFKAPGGTYYGCFWKEIDMADKVQIIGWKGQIEGNRNIHHQQVSISRKPPYLTQQGGLCRLPTVEYTWAGVQDTEWTPGLAGFPVGGAANGGKAYFVWQVHFEGATTYSGGFDAIITRTPRKYDAGNFEQGDMNGIDIPPGQHTHVAKCDSVKTTQKITQPIYVWSSLLHAHQIISNIKAELFRGGQLIHTFGNLKAGSNGIGVNDKPFLPQNPCVEIRPGDELVTTCDYFNNTDRNVVGGEATTQEMCMTFLTYFPRLPAPQDSYCGTIEGP